MIDNKDANAHSSHPVAIIGLGPAGMNAAIALRAYGYDGDIEVFSDIDGLPYSPILTSYYVAGEKSYEECFPWSDAEIDDLGLIIHGNSPVTHLDVEKRLIEADGKTYPYSKCVIATGSRPLANGFPRDCGYAPLMLRSMQDASEMKKAFECASCKKVLISGASMVALKTLEAALAHRLDVSLVGMNPHVLDFNALPQVAERFERGLAERGVSLYLGQTIKSVDVIEDVGAYKERRLRVTFSSGQSNDYDEICVAHGMACNLDFLDDGSLEMENALLVDEHMRTSNPDIYAAGDVAQALELVSGKKKIVGIWKNAVNQGQVAGRSIAYELDGGKLDEDEEYRGSISSNTIAVDGLLFTSGGTIDTQGEKGVEVIEDEKMTLVCIYDPNRHGPDGDRCLIGYNLACDEDEAGSRAYDIGAMLSMRIERNCS